MTGSMQTWPAEIFDRLPLLYNTLAQYRPDLEVLFVPRLPAQVAHQSDQPPHRGDLPVADVFQDGCQHQPRGVR